jgi:hypothetical protein
LIVVLRCGFGGGGGGGYSSGYESGGVAVRAAISKFEEPENASGFPLLQQGKKQRRC